MSIRFDGQDDEILFGNDPSLQVIESMAFGLWCRTDQTGLYHGMGGKLVDTPTYDGWALAKSNTNLFRALIGDSIGAYIINANSANTDSNWHCVYMTRIGGTCYLYVDGVQQTATMNYSIVESGDDFEIGRQYSTFDDRWWNGDLCDVRVYSRGLTEAEMKTIYACRGTDGIVYGLVARYLLDERPEGITVSGADSVKDLSIYGNHGSPVSAPTYQSNSLLKKRKVA